ncbi:right-handed parallel beta-helix repeat-containing protein [Paenibacillus athensensis]|uniref:right-handed parallel beta-helix repeat-containing protein n=1 Tax=Paenibacillus athensensis TaxID=1967502 RepID=UPI0014302BBE|nr:NosD domain-containing protein [Paenibacillus athensensis]MCD1261429.1 right-handed parallel beta-helix repeat-containing protein [Paenibacillus athensensis]
MENVTPRTQTTPIRAVKSIWLFGLLLLLLSGTGGAASSAAGLTEAPVASSPAVADSPLQLLIDAAAPGSAIRLEAGHTYRGPAIVNKSLTIRADSGATLVNDAGQPALTLKADGITLVGLHIADGQTDPKSGAVLVQSRFNTISGLEIVTQAGGIYLRSASDNVIEGNRIVGAHALDPGEPFSRRGNGIDLLASPRNRIENNELVHVHDGIYAESSNEVRLTGNRATSSRYGFHVMFSAKPQLIGNTGSYNVTGAMIMAVEGALVQDNRFDKQTENVNSQGILLYDVHRAAVSGNRVEGNRVGFYIEQSSDNLLVENVAAGNFIGMQMLRSDRNTFRSGSFIANVIQAQATESRNNALDGNYWDDFRGLDTDGDGYSNLGYEVDPFFLKLTERVEAYRLFFQAPGLPFLQQMFRADTANWLRDARPLMSPPTSGAPATAGGRSIYLVIAVVLLLGSSIVIYQWGVKTK